MLCSTVNHFSFYLVEIVVYVSKFVISLFEIEMLLKKYIWTQANHVKYNTPELHHLCEIGKGTINVLIKVSYHFGRITTVITVQWLNVVITATQ